ncbi:MAG: class I SAM-dependent methyltransferase [SAR202 cluster bacterium]|nr:class I SAM-dependent methyltransferase [SAR202 cluster bacterium]
MYDPQHTQNFYDAYGLRGWDRLEATAYGRLKAIIHADIIETYLKSGDRVLDAGCGPGRFSIVMAELGARVTALDISPGQLELAREKISEAGLLSQMDGFVHSDIVDLSQIQDASYDMVICYGGALSYVSEHRHQAASELVRVTRPGGIILVSVMSRYGAVANLVRRPSMTELLNPEEQHVWRVTETGELPDFESLSMGTQHPAMQLYSSDDLRSLLPDCEVLEMAASCATVHEGSPAIEEISQDSEAWNTAVEIERRLCRMPGLLDIGSHVIMAARKTSVR